MKILKGFCLLFSYLSFFFLCIVLFSSQSFFFLSRTFFPVCRRTFFSGCRTFSLSAVPFIISSLSYFSPLSRTDFFSLSSLFDLSRIFPSPSYFSPLCRIFIFLHFSLPTMQALFQIVKQCFLPWRVQRNFLSLFACFLQFQCFSRFSRHIHRLNDIIKKH